MQPSQWCIWLGFLGALAAVPGCGDDDEKPTTDAAVDVLEEPDTVGEVDEVLEEPDAPPVDDFSIPGLSAPVTVTVDQYGIPHLACEQLADCHAAQGYIMAANRFYQMDLLRHLIRGRMSRFIGALGLDSDRVMRPFMSTPQGVPLEELLWDQTDSEGRAALEAFARGVNAWLADLRAGRNGATLSEEYRLSLLESENIPDWEVLDSLACGLYMLDDLSNQSETELALGEAFAALPSEVALDLFPLRPATTSTIVGASGGQYPLRANPSTGHLHQVHERLHLALPTIRKARHLLASLHLFPVNVGIGSNSWVVGPDRTATGVSLVANDPHLGLGNPPALFLNAMHIDVGGDDEIHMMGASLPGFPGLLIGHNDHIVWGVTTAYHDLADVYVEQFTGTGGVYYDGGVVDLVTVEHTFEVRGAEPVVETLTWVPHHGPVVSMDEASSTGVSIRWVGHQGSTDPAVFLKLNQASTVAEAEQALRFSVVNDQCFVITDISGTIAWYAPGTIPTRPWASLLLAPWLPLPGDGSAEWTGWVDFDDLPSLVNPANGFIATANNAMTAALLDGDPTNDGYPVFQTLPSVGFRHQRIVDLLQAGEDDHTIETMLAIQADTRSLLGERLVPFLLAASAAGTDDLTQAGAELVEALDGWDFTCPTGLSSADPEGEAVSDAGTVAEAAGCSAFHVALFHLLGRFAGDELAQAELSLTQVTGFIVRSLLNALEHPETLASGEALWDDLSTTDQTESKSQVMIEAMNEAASWLTTNLGAQSETWLWGRIHTFTLRSDLFDAAGLTAFNNGPYANDGGLYTVDVANPRGIDGNFGYRHGPVLRMVAEVSQDGITTRMQFAGGNDLHRSSDFYDNMLANYIENEPVVLPFTPQEVATQAVRTFTIRPE